MNTTTCTTTERAPSRSAPAPRFASITAVFIAAALCCTGLTTARAAEDNSTFSTWGTLLYGGEPFSSSAAPIWSPDGKWIALVESPIGLSDGRSVKYKYISIISSGGGAPTRVFDHYAVIQPEGKKIFILPGQTFFGGFSPDNKYLYYSYAAFDESRGSFYTYTPQDGGYSLTLGGFLNVVNRLDITTGEAITVAEGGWCKLSRSGKFLLYGTNGQNTTAKNLETGETWTLPVFNGSSCCITPDDKSVIYTASIPNPYSTEGQLYRIPITGGTAVKLTQYTSGDIFGRLRLWPTCSPDGKWVVYLDQNETISFPFSFTFTSLKRTGTVLQQVFFALSLETGENIALTPITNSNWFLGGNFNSDGTQFCYLRADHSNEYKEYSIHIKDFDPEGLKNGIITAIADALPSGFAIAGNFPNPFNPSTAISFSLPKTGTASLAVYDITGRKVRDLAAGLMTAGAHSAVWNGRDASGRAVSSGVYFARLSLGGAAVTHRMTLMK